MSARGGGQRSRVRRSRLRRARAWLGALALLGALLPGAARGDEPAAERSEWARLVAESEFGASLRGSFWSDSRRLKDEHDVGVAALWLRGRSQLAPAVAVAADGWVMNDDLFDARSTKARLREGYVDVRLGPLDLRLGQQIVAWGRADRVNPTDNLTPRDFTLLVPEDSDQRSGTVGLRAAYHLQGFTLTGLWLPVFEPHTIPIETPPDPFVLERRHAPSAPLTQFGFKVDQTGGPVDWSVSYFDGLDLYPDLEITALGPTKIRVRPTHHRVRVVGADVAAVWGPYGLRAEAAYTFTEQSEHNQVKSPFLFLVLGADRTFLGSLNVNLQFVLRVVTDYRDPRASLDPVTRAVATEQATINSQLDRVQESITFRISKKWLGDTLETEVGSIVGLNRLDFGVRPKVTYAITDRLRATVGADIYRGPTPSFFGRVRDLSTAYVELRWDLL